MGGLDALLTGEVVYGLLLLLVFGAIAGLFAAVNAMLAARGDAVGDRVRRVTAENTSSMLDDALPLAQPGSTRSLFDFTFRPLAKVATPTDEDELGRLRAQLSHAGYRSERAMPIYLAAKVALCFACAGAFMWVNSLQPAPLDQAALYTIVVMIIGFYFPNFWLRNRVQERMRLVSNAMPDTLDLLVTCVEAGLGLDQALLRVSQEIGLSAPLLAHELNQTSLEMRAGVGRGETFRRLALRTGVEEIKNLASIVIQTELFGTSVARALRVMADSMRVRRMQRAEENAATVAVRMTLPLILCILPALLVTLLGPAVVRMIRILVPTLGGSGPDG